MSSVDVTREAATALVGRVERRTRSRVLAYDYVASRIGRSSRWLRGLINEGVGRIDNHIGGLIDGLLLKELEAECARLEHELALARQIGAHPASQHISAIETYLERVRSLMAGKEISGDRDLPQ